MESATMGGVTTEARVTSLRDLCLSQSGHLPAEQIRQVIISNALVDTRTTMLSLPTRLIQQLGLQRVSSRRVTNSAGTAETWIYDPVRLTIHGRDCSVDVVEALDTSPP